MKREEKSFGSAQGGNPEKQRIPAEGKRKKNCGIFKPKEKIRK